MTCILGTEEGFPSTLLLRLQLEPRGQQFHPLGVVLLHHGMALAKTASTRTAAHLAIGTAAHHRAMTALRTSKSSGGQTDTGDRGGDQQTFT